MSRQLFKSLSISFVFHTVAVAALLQLVNTIPDAKRQQAISFSLIASAPVENADKTVQKEFAETVLKKSPRDKNPISEKLPTIEQKPPLPLLAKKVEETIPPEFIAAAQAKRKIKSDIQKKTKTSKNVIEPKERPSGPPDVAQDFQHQRPPSKGKKVFSASTETNNRQSAQSAEIPVSAETIQQQYLEDHFSSIRERVSRKLRYPPIARKMGWQGRVVVSFIIRIDGHAEDIAIVESCGFRALDKNAIELIKACLPFPKPELSAKITLPIIYKLN